MKIPTFVIGLQRLASARADLIAALGRCGIEAQPWEGVDGRLPIELREGESVSPANRVISLAKYGRPQPPTILGCYLAHYRLLKHALEQGYERVLVFEDDAAPLPAFGDVLAPLLELDDGHEHINLQPEHWPMPFLSDIAEHAKLTRPLPLGHQLSRNVDRAHAARSYLINRAGLAKLVPFLMPQLDEVDLRIDQAIWTGVLRGYSVWPPLTLHLDNRTISRGGAGPLKRLQYAAVRKLYRGRFRSYKAEQHRQRRELLESCKLEYGAS